MGGIRVVKEIENPYSTGESFEQLLEEVKTTEPKEGTVVRGVVISIEKENVVVDIGFKSEGRIQLREFPPEERESLKSGDEIEVYLERVENSRSEAVLSREKAVREESWTRLEKIHGRGENVTGIIFGRVKGGFTVDLEGAVAFLPGSQVDVRPVKDISHLMGMPQEFQILKMDRKRGNIVVSRRAILEESRSAEREEALSGIEEGMTLEGIVKNITDYGAFIDLGAVDGLLHVTDISWQRITHPSEVLKLGEKIKVKVIKYDKDTQRISLGLKQLEESPWKDAGGKYKADSRHKGHITNITDYGAFVELEPGIEGLVHISEMSWTKKNIHPNKLVSVGQEVEAVILSIDSGKRRLSLGMKQCESNPWEEFASKHKVGEVLEGEIKSIADFGLFVGFDRNIDGLVHVSDLSWSGKPDEELKNYNKGDKIKVKVLDIDPAKERIALGVKQLAGDPFDNAIKGLGKGAISTFTVSAVKDSGIEVEVSEGLTSFIKKNDLSRDRIECRPDRFSVGDRVDAKVIDVDKNSRAVKLSIKALEIDEQKQAIADYGSADSGASLGGILGVALDSAKKKAAEEGTKKAAKKETKKAEKKSEDKAEKKPAKKAASKKETSAKKTTAKAKVEKAEKKATTKKKATVKKKKA